MSEAAGDALHDCRCWFPACDADDGLSRVHRHRFDIAARAPRWLGIVVARDRLPVPVRDNVAFAGPRAGTGTPLCLPPRDRRVPKDAMWSIGPATVEQLGDDSVVWIGPDETVEVVRMNVCFARRKECGAARDRVGSSTDCAASAVGVRDATGSDDRAPDHPPDSADEGLERGR